MRVLLRQCFANARYKLRIGEEPDANAALSKPYSAKSKPDGYATSATTETSRPRFTKIKAPTKAKASHLLRPPPNAATIRPLSSSGE
jgi:hypothetical protein